MKSETMALSKKTVGIIVAMMIISMAGLIVLQITLLGSSKKLKEQTFRRNVSNALVATAEQLEALEATVVAMDVASDSTISWNVVGGKLQADTLYHKISNITIFATESTLVDSAFPKNVRALMIKDSICDFDTSLSKMPLFEHNKLIDLDTNYKDSSRYIVKLNMKKDSGRVEFLQEIVNRIWNADSSSILDRIDLQQLESILKSNLSEAGIGLDYVYGIKALDNDTILPGPTSYENELLSSTFRTRLFPRDFLSSPYELLLYFPEGDYYIWKQIGTMLFLTSLFLIIIMLCFVYTIRIIMAQRKNSRLMVDFVNNMTHEFKTPISTVALAGEAIVRSDVLPDGEKVTRYSKMILDENMRMHRQVEKILQMAALEEGDFELSLSSVDIHKIISAAIDSITLQIDSRGGEITKSLNADQFIMQADKDHLSNIIYNLLDNAVKYSPENPMISISTRNDDGGIYIGIDDKGRGIDADSLKMVFRKYYRVSTGNLHNVKGFGLGLSYVKLMVEAHGGKISIKSRLGEGTYAEVFFPLPAVPQQGDSDGG